MLPATQHELCLRGVHALLRPGGVLTATVWDRMALLEVGGRCLAKVTGQAEPLELPYDPTCLGHGRADTVMRAAGFELLEAHMHHNRVDPLELHLGAVGADDTWVLGLLPFQGTLAALHERGDVAHVFESARDAFWEEAEAAGWMVDGQVVVQGLEYRLLVGRKAL